MAVTDDTTAPAPRPALWRNRDFQFLWLGAGISMLGARVSGVAVPLLVIWQGGSPFTAGLVSVVGLLPLLILQLPAGVLVDRWDRRRTMIASDLAGLVAMGTLATTLMLGRWWVALLMAVVFVENTAAVFYRLSERAGVRNVVDPEHLTAALAQNEARGRVAGLIGQPLGAVLYSLVRFAPFAFAALGHLVALILLLFIRRSFQSGPRPPRRDMRRQLAEGMRWLWRQPFLRSVLLLVAGTNILFQVLPLALVLIIKESGGSPALLGIIGAVSGAGGALGALSGSWVVRRVSPAAIVIGAFAVWTVLMPAVALTDNPLLLGALMAGMTAAGAVMNVTAGVYQVQVTPDEMQGRVGSVSALMSSGTNSLGAFAAGVLLTALGTTPTLIGVGVAMLAITLGAAVSPAVRSARQIAADPRRDAPHSSGKDGI